MQKIFLGKSNRLFLQTGESIDAAKLSIVGPTGSFLKDAGEVDFDERVCTLDGSSGKFYLDVTLSSSSVADDAFCNWEATKDSIAVVLEGEFDPEDAAVVSSISTETYLVTPTFVMDNFLRGISESDIEDTFVGFGFRDTIRSQILASTRRLQEKVQVSFTKVVVTNEFHDWDETPLYEKFWTQRLFHTPVVSVEKMELRLKDQVLSEIPAEWIQVGNQIEGIVKTIPYAGGEAGFSFKLIWTIGSQLALIGGGVYYYPDFFVYDYTHGLDWDNLETGEKTDIKNAIGRRVALQMLPNLDTHRGLSSESKSIDGAAAQKSYTSSAIYGEHSAAIENYKKEESAWVNEVKRKYLKRLMLDGYQ